MGKKIRLGGLVKRAGKDNETQIVKFCKLLTLKTKEADVITLAIYKDENGKMYISCCGWGINEGYKLKKGYNEINVVKRGNYLEGGNGILFDATAYDDISKLIEDVRNVWIEAGVNLVDVEVAQ
mgnify:CR=1 FL=1